MAMLRGLGSNNKYGQVPRPAWTSPTNTPQGAYGAAVNQNAEDYDKIMGNYDTLFKQSQSNSATRTPLSYSPINPQSYEYSNVPQYSQTADLAALDKQLADFSKTGGYSDTDISSMRARGIDPIRSVYAGALNNLRRQKSLQGGYSPNYGALQAKLAREQAGIIGERTSAINADIAEKVNEGKKFAMSSLSPIRQRRDELAHQVELQNAAGVNRANEMNAAERARVEELNRQLLLDYERYNSGAASNDISQGLQAVSGAANLYGTTPALANMFGNQVLNSNAQNLQGQTAEANIRQQRANTGTQLVGMGVRRPINYTGLGRA